jgi:hypothetical protein
MVGRSALQIKVSTFVRKEANPAKNACSFLILSDIKTKLSRDNLTTCVILSTLSATGGSVELASMKTGKKCRDSICEILQLPDLTLKLNTPCSREALEGLELYLLTLSKY